MTKSSTPLLSTISPTSHSVEFHTFGVVDERITKGKYFSNFMFIGGRYRDNDALKYAHQANDYTLQENWSEAWDIDPTNAGLVVDSLNLLNKRMNHYDDNSCRLFKFKVDYTLEEVNTRVDEYEEIRKWRAIGKLAPEEISLLGLEKTAMYLKLKYADDMDDNGLNANDGYGNSF